MLERGLPTEEIYGTQYLVKISEKFNQQISPLETFGIYILASNSSEAFESAVEDYPSSRYKIIDMKPICLQRIN